MFLEEIHGLPV